MTAPILYSVTRDERAEQVLALRAEGLLGREIAARLGISSSYVRDLIYDPDGSKNAARRLRYGRKCEDCGARTFGGDGAAKAPKVCEPCTRKRREAQHGTRSRYQAGCSCDDCRRANRDANASLKGKTPPTHSASGYSNYGCRCQVCRDAHLVFMRARNWEHQKAWEARIKGTEPPRHGTTTGYTKYGCRCDDCRRANTEASRRWRARQRVAA